MLKSRPVPPERAKTRIRETNLGVFGLLGQCLGRFSASNIEILVIGKFSIKKLGLKSGCQIMIYSYVDIFSINHWGSTKKIRQKMRSRRTMEFWRGWTHPKSWAYGLGAHSASELGYQFSHRRGFSGCTASALLQVRRVHQLLDLLDLPHCSFHSFVAAGDYIRYTPHLALGHWWICQWKNTYAKQKTYCTQKWMNYDHSHTKFIWWRYLSFPQYSTFFYKVVPPSYIYIYIYVCLETPLSIIT